MATRRRAATLRRDDAGRAYAGAPPIVAERAGGARARGRGECGAIGPGDCVGACACEASDGATYAATASAAGDGDAGRVAVRVVGGGGAREIVARVGGERDVRGVGGGGERGRGGFLGDDAARGALQVELSIAAERRRASTREGRRATAGMDGASGRARGRC